MSSYKGWWPVLEGPWGGVPAGCPFVAYEVQMYVLRLADDFVAAHLRVMLIVFIDDRFVESEDAHEEVLANRLKILWVKLLLLLGLQIVLMK